MAKLINAWMVLALQYVVGVGCSNDCNVGQTTAAPKISPSLRQEMQAAGSDVEIAVVITATTVKAVACVNEAIVRNEGPVARGIPSGTRVTAASLPARAIEMLATRADVQRLGVDFDPSELPRASP
jgi:hypothetical protein